MRRPASSRLAYLASVATIVGARAVLAEEPAADEGAVTVTARRVPEPAREADRSLVTVPSETLTRAQPRSVPEALREVPGVAFQATNRGAGAPILRGLIGPRNLILLDGVRINQSTWRNGPLQYLAQFDPWSLDRIEVQLGPGSVVHGSDAMGGVVQLLSARAPATDGFSTGGRIAFRTADLGVEPSAFVGGRTGPFAARASGAYRNYGLLFNGRQQLPYTDYQSFGASARMWFEPAPTISVSTAYFAGGVRDAGRTDLLGTGRLTRFDNTLHIAYADVRHTPARGPLREIRVLVSTLVSDDDSRQYDCDSADGYVVDAQACLAGGSAVRRIRAFHDRVITPGLVFTADVGRPSDRYRIVVGADTAVDLVQSDRSTATRPGYTATPDARGNFSNGSRNVTGGAFVTADVDALGQPSARHRLVLSGGARVAWFSAHAPDVPVVGAVDTAQAGAVGHGSVRYLFDRRLTVYASWAQGLRAPGLQEATFLGVEGGAYVIPNRDLAPERSNSVETGVRGEFGPVRFHAAGSIAIVDGFIVRENVPTEAWLALGVDRTEVGSLQVQRNANASRGRILAFEASLRVRLVPWLHAWADAALLRGDTWDASGRESPASKTPPSMGAFGLRAQHGRLYGELFVRWAAPQDRLSGSDRSDLRICEDPQALGHLLANCSGTPAWVTVHARGGLMLTRAVRLDLAIENLTNTRYRYHASGVDEPGAGVVLGLSGSL